MYCRIGYEILSFFLKHLSCPEPRVLDLGWFIVLGSSSQYERELRIAHIPLVENLGFGSLNN